MAEGTIKRLVADRGFGFIAASGDNEYFFHRSGVDNFDSLQVGQSVTFDVEQGPKGPRAGNVKVTA